MNINPTIGWGWFLVLHIITIPLLLYWGAAIREPKDIEK